MPATNANLDDCDPHIFILWSVIDFPFGFVRWAWRLVFSAGLNPVESEPGKHNSLISVLLVEVPDCLVFKDDQAGIGAAAGIEYA